MQMASVMASTPSISGPVLTIAAQDDGAGGVALHGDGQQRAVVAGRGIAGDQQRGLNAFVHAHPAQRGFDGQMQRAAAAARKLRFIEVSAPRSALSRWAKEMDC
jgi:hypothetical protein